MKKLAISLSIFAAIFIGIELDILPRNKWAIAHSQELKK
jgi:hypothetical protein